MQDERGLQGTPPADKKKMAFLSCADDTAKTEGYLLAKTCTEPLETFSSPAVFLREIGGICRRERLRLILEQSKFTAAEIPYMQPFI